LTAEIVESCYTPIIQSGGVYDLKPSAVSNDQNLHFGTIICALGARYKYYCSNVARTYFVDPKKDQEENYKVLLAVHDCVIKSLKPGVKLSEVYDTAVNFLKKKKPALVDSFVKSLGFGMGLEFRESALAITAKNTREIKAGMVFNICTGFKNLEIQSPKDPKKKIYSIMLADTVKITKDEGSKVLTTSCPKELDKVAYYIEDDVDTKPTKKETKRETKSSTTKSKSGPQTRRSSSTTAAPELTTGRRTRQREKENKKDIAAEEKRRLHQQELERAKREEAQRKYNSSNPDSNDDEENQGEIRDKCSYDSIQQLPIEAHNNNIYIDPRRESLLLPIYGLLVPFHITTVKSVSKSDDYLRINFITPGSTTIGANKLPVVFKDPKCIFFT
jgi:nucleosome binding factor SPN SPT16 subunit